MGESEQHMSLVRILDAWVRAQSSSTDWVCVFADLPETPPREKPPLVDGFRPDIWAEDIPRTFTLLGEAKTASDLETEHSTNQLRAFLQFLSLQSAPHLVIATPLRARASARSLVAQLAREWSAENVRRSFITEFDEPRRGGP